jgi:5-methylcytosine-specific restriction protein A
MSNSARWWAGEPEERFWLEATDRNDIGADLRAPELDSTGRPNWRYTLFMEARQGDMVLHYDKSPSASGIIGFSYIAGSWRQAPIVWAARGTFARARGDEPHERNGYVVPLEGFTSLAQPLLLSQLRERAADLVDLLTGLRQQHGAKAALYFPFEVTEVREPRLLQGYAFKLPAQFLSLFPELAAVPASRHRTAAPLTGGIATDQAHRTTDSTDESADKKAPTGRNPPWTRDELILALDLYMRHQAAPPGKNSAEIAELSALLNRLHRLSARDARPDFRNPNGVYMKLMNFRRFDPAYTAAGKTGLSRGNRDEERVWAEFSSTPPRLFETAKAIRAAVRLNEPHFSAIALNEEEEGQTEAPEGRLLTRLHRYRERDRDLVRLRKDKALREFGFLRCEVCEFDFAATYGERGYGFIECHHTRPLHTLQEGDKTRLQDLALLCANCHRMVHATRPWLSLEELGKTFHRS